MWGFYVVFVLVCNHLEEEERELVALLLLSYGCLVTLNVLRLFLTVLWVGLQCVIVIFPDHTHLLFCGPCLHCLLERLL